MRYDKRTAAEVLASSELVGTEPTLDGGIRLVPDDKSPNPNWREAEREGEATGWGVDLPPRTVGDSHYVTQPGKRPNSPGNPATAAGVLLEETFPPRRATLARQTPIPTPSGVAWTAEGEILPGAGPWAHGAADRPKPDRPEARAVARSEVGFSSAVYGTAFGFADGRKNMTPPSEFVFTDGPVAEGQGLRQPLPDVSGADAPYLYVAVTGPGRGEGSARVLKWVDLRKSVPSFVDIAGPYDESRRRPPDKNRTGVGTLPAPFVGRARPASRSRSWVEEERGPASFGVRAARYRFHLVVRTPRGVSIWGEGSREVVVEGDVDRVARDETHRFARDANELVVQDNPFVGGTRVLLLADENASPPEPLRGGRDYFVRSVSGNRFRLSETRDGAPIDLTSDGSGALRGPVTEEVRRNERKGRVFRFRPPRNLPDDWDFGVGVEITPTRGAPSFWRVGPKGGGPDYFFGDRRDGGTAGRRDRMDGVPVWGYAQEDAPAGMEMRLHPAEKPSRDDPEADGTAIPAPDSAPDAPYATGVPQPKPGSYLAATAEAVDGYPGEGPMSRPSPSVAVGPNQTLRVRAARRMGQVPNAEGSEKNRTGGPVGFSSYGLSFPVSETIDDGIFSYSTTTTVGPAAFWARTGPKWHLPQGTETVMCVVGTLRVSADVAGATEAVLVQYDDAGAEIGTKPLVNRKGQALQMDGPGVRTLLPRGAAFGPGFAPYSDGAAAVALRFRAAPTAGNPAVDQTQWNQRATFEDFQIFPFAEPLRKFERDPIEPSGSVPPADSDAVSAATRYPSQTEFALGPAPSVVGKPAPGPAPLEVVDFAGGAWPAGWVEAPATGGASQGVERQPDGSYSWRVSDQSTGTNSQRGRSKAYPPGTRLAARFLVDLDNLTNAGEVRFGGLLDQDGNFLCLFRLTPTQLRLYRCRADGSPVEGRTVVSGLADHGALDVEVAVAGGDTREGLIRCSAGLDSPRSATAAFSGVNLSGRTPERVSAVVRETSSAGRWGFRLRNVVVTRGGDVLDREQPSSAAGDLPPDPDAPPVAGAPGAFRVLDASGERLNQWWGVVETGLGAGRGIGYRTLAPIVLVPGKTCTHALQWRHLLLEPDSTEDPVHQFFVTLRGEGVPDLEVGSPFGPGPDADAVGRISGPRSGANTSPPSGMAPFSEWGEEDFWHCFTAPDGYTEAHIGPKNDAPAIMVPQEHLFTDKGAFTTQEARDARRAYGHEVSGTARITLDSRVRDAEFTPPALVAQRWVSFGASHGGGDDPDLAWTARSADEGGLPEGVGWSDWATPDDPLAVPERAVLQLGFSLAAGPDGAPGPEVPPGSVYLETRPLSEPVLLDENRRPFPGMVVAGDAEAYPFAEENEDPVGGHASSVRLSEEIERLPPMYLLAFTAEAERALRAVTARTVLYHEDPFGGPDGLGRVRRIRFYGRLDVESSQRSPGPRRWAGSRRVLAAVSATPEAEVLESSVMGEARAASQASSPGSGGV